VKLEMKLKRSNLLESLPILADMDAVAISTLVKILKLETFSDAVDLFEEGDLSDKL